jgi:hypothetical protein
LDRVFSFWKIVAERYKDPEPVSREEAQKKFSEMLKEHGIELEEEDWDEIFAGHIIYVLTRDGIARVSYDGIVFSVDRIIQEEVEVDKND